MMGPRSEIDPEEASAPLSLMLRLCLAGVSVLTAFWGGAGAQVTLANGDYRGLSTMLLIPVLISLVATIGYFLGVKHWSRWGFVAIFCCALASYLELVIRVYETA